MMKILFCNTSFMKYYRGACDLGIPQSGGSFVDENGYGHEKFDLMPDTIIRRQGSYGRYPA